MPNLLPDWLPWIHPAGRLIWSVIIFTVGIIFVFALMKPPQLAEGARRLGRLIESIAD